VARRKAVRLAPTGGDDEPRHQRNAAHLAVLHRAPDALMLLPRREERGEAMPLLSLRS
jgi:hypothetical protein